MKQSPRNTNLGSRPAYLFTSDTSKVGKSLRVSQTLKLVGFQKSHFCTPYHVKNVLAVDT